MKNSPAVRFELEDEKDGDPDYGIYNDAKARVGRLAVALIPGDDRVFVMQFHIERDQRENGYGTAAIELAAQMHGRVIVPVNDHSGGYWEKLRGRDGISFMVEEGISTTDFYNLVAAAGEAPSPR